MGKSLSGEAYETLAIILADLALLLESNAAHSHHPGLLVHDSPREADLYVGIYQKLLDLADAECVRRRRTATSPFQYIVTTTTLPSKKLQHKSITKLKLSGGSGSLFGRQLETAKSASEQQRPLRYSGGSMNTNLKPAVSPLQLRDELETMVLKELLGPGSAEEEIIESPGTRYFVGVLAPRKRAKAGAAPAKPAVVPTAARR